MQKTILINQLKDWFLGNKQNNLNIGFPNTELSEPSWKRQDIWNIKTKAAFHRYRGGTEEINSIFRVDAFYYL